MTRIWDPGLQNERTTLAWVRTSLALLASALVLARLAASASAGLTGTVAGGALALTFIVVRLAKIRYRATAASLRAGRPLPDGRLPASLAGLAAFVGLSGIAYVIL